MDYKGYVLVKFQDRGPVYLFEGPKFCSLKAGTLVDVGGRDYGVVIMSDTYREDAEEVKALVEACGATIPLKKVLAVMDRRELHYPPQGLGEEDF